MLRNGGKMKKFMMIWIGELISSIGSGMTAFALSIYVYEMTGSVSYVSLVTSFGICFPVWGFCIFYGRYR